LFFTADDGVHSWELWKSDGTDAGTVLVRDIYPGALPSIPTSLTVFNGTLYFVALSDSGFELWQSDGTAAGTVLVQDINPGPGSSIAPAVALTNRPLTVAGGRLFFAADDGTSGVELWAFTP